MKRLLFAMICLPTAVTAAPVEDTCLQRNLGDAHTCSCAQKAADETVRPGLHSLIADHLGRRVDVAVIAAERGHSGAEALFDANEAFSKALKKHCQIDFGS